MTNSKELFNDLVNRITLPEDKSEIRSIVCLLLEKKLGLTQTEILAGKKIPQPESKFFDQAIQQINSHMPIQYILGETIFYGRHFIVSQSVLIPRPETEFLIHELKNNFQRHSPRTVLDIGTGSGCLAITLALELPGSVVHATDISQEAIQVAQQNATALGTNIQFHKHDILKEEITFGSFDLIVSNPPYISAQEKTQIKSNVLDYEPHLALFAPPEDPLVFYKAIAKKSIQAIRPGGTVWVEINEHFGLEVLNIFKSHGYREARVIKDLDNKDRFVTAHL